MTINLSTLIGKSNADLTTILNAATSAATANTLALRDANANISVGTATASSHAVNKSVTDAITSTVSGHTTSIGTLNTEVAALQTLTGGVTYSAATNSPTNLTLMARDANGRAQVNDPAGTKDIANYEWTNAQIAAATASIVTSITIGASQSGATFNANANTHYPINIASNSVQALFPQASTCIGQEIELFVTTINAVAGTYSLSWAGQSGSTDVFQAPVSGGTDLYSCYTFRAVATGIWRLVARS